MPRLPELDNLVLGDGPEIPEVDADVQVGTHEPGTLVTVTVNLQVVTAESARFEWDVTKESKAPVREAEREAAHHLGEPGSEIGHSRPVVVALYEDPVAAKGLTDPQPVIGRTKEEVSDDVDRVRRLYARIPLLDHPLVHLAGRCEGSRAVSDDVRVVEVVIAGEPDSHLPSLVGRFFLVHQVFSTEN